MRISPQKREQKRASQARLLACGYHTRDLAAISACVASDVDAIEQWLTQFAVAGYRDMTLNGLDYSLVSTFQHLSTRMRRRIGYAATCFMRNALVREIAKYKPGRAE